MMAASTHALGAAHGADVHVTPFDKHPEIRLHRRLRGKALGQPWAGMATLNPFWMFGRESRADGTWAGWVYAVDADSGLRKLPDHRRHGADRRWRVVFFGDISGNIYALDAATGEKLWGQ